MKILNQFAITICIILSEFICGYCQPVFKKNYDYATLSNFNNYELPSKRFISSLGAVSIIDTLGNIQSLRALIYPPGGYWRTIVKTGENNFYIDGLITDTTCFSFPGIVYFIARIDTNLHIQNISEYTLMGSCRMQAVNMDKTMHNGTISVGKCLDKFYAFCIDSVMHPIWGKYYTNHTGGTQFGKQTPDGGFLLGFNLDTAGAVVAKTDSMGNTIWCKSYIRPKGYIHDCVINPDGTSIITGFTDSVNIPPSGTYPPGFAPKLFMIKLDTAGNVLWAKAFDSDRHWLMWRSSIIRTNDGGYALFASVAYNPSIKPILIKTDANGDTLWTRIHGEPGTFYEAISILQTSDHGYLLGGAAPYNGIPTWLYKTDSLGRTYCHELEQTTYVFPIFPVDSNVVLTSIDGAIEVPISLTDTTYPPHAVWDDCIPNQMDGPKWLSSGLKVYPNPTTGKLILEFSGPLISDCWFSVYDHTGRLVFQKILYTEKEKIEIDLSPFGKGLYLVEFTEKDQVSVKKVVVE